MNLILADKSPQRARLLAEAGLAFKVVTPDVDESMFFQSSPQELVKVVAEAKGCDVLKYLTRSEDTAVLSCAHCMIRSSDKVFLQKPVADGDSPDKDLAREMLESYVQNSISVFTYMIVDFLSGPYRNRYHDHAFVSVTPFSESEISEILEDPATYRAHGALPYRVEGSPASKIIEKHLTLNAETRPLFLGLSIKQVKTALSSVSYPAAA